MEAIRAFLLHLAPEIGILKEQIKVLVASTSIIVQRDCNWASQSCPGNDYIEYLYFSSKLSFLEGIRGFLLHLAPEIGILKKQTRFWSLVHH